MQFAKAGLALALILSATPASAQVEMAPLQPLDYFSAGSRDTGLPPDLWRGSSGEIAAAVIPTLADKPLSPATEDLARRVLAAAATGPDGAGSDEALAVARARALLALGDAATVNAMLQRAAGLQDSPGLSQAAAEAALIVGDEARACAVGQSLANGRGEVYWLRLRAYCQVRAGDLAAAQLTYTLANQADRDPTYARLMGALLAGGGADPGPASLKSGLELALSHRLGLDPAPALADAHPAIQAQFPRGLEPPSSDLIPIGASPQALAEALGKARGVDAFTRAARAHAPFIAAMAPQAWILDNPALFARAAVAAGELEAAQAIRASMVQDKVPGATITDLALLDALLAAANGRSDRATLDRLIERGAAGGSKSPAQPAALLMAATGAPMSGQARAEFANFNVARGSASPARLTAMDYAAGAGLKGETALLALTIAAEAGPDGPAPADRARIIRALDRAGLAEAGRAFAVEGLLALQVR